MQPTRAVQRRAFTIVVIPCLLAVSMIIMGFILADRAPSANTPSAAYNAGNKAGSYFGPVIFAAFMLWLASRIAERRSHFAANLWIGGILLLANVAMLMNVLGLAKPVPPRNSLAGASQSSPSRDPSPNTPVPQPSTSAPSTPPVGPPQSSPGRSIPSRPTAPPSQPAPSQPTPAPAQVAPSPAFDAAPTLAALTAELDEKRTKFLAAATQAYATAAKPKAFVKGLDDQMQELADVKKQATEFEALSQSLVSTAWDRLKSAGMPSHEAHGAAMKFSDAYRAFERQVAAGEVARMTDSARDYFTIGRDNIKKITVNAQGRFTTRDRDVETKLFHAGASLEFALKSKAETLRKLGD